MQNKFLSKFDTVKSKFNKKLKDNIFTREIDTFKKYNIIDENNMFNYIYIHNYYENLIVNPFQYKINIISKNKEQVLTFFSLLLHEENLNFEYKNKLIYQTFLKSNNDKTPQKFFDLYKIKEDNNNNKNIIIKNKSFKEIIEYINYENNNQNEYIITTAEYIFNSYPSIIFHFYIGDNLKTEIMPLINKNLEEDYLNKNKNFILFEKDILNKYFNGKNTLYLNEQIYHRTTSLLSTLNIFLFNEEEWKKNKTSILDEIKIKKEEKYKDIIINNLIYNLEKKKLYFTEVEKEKDLFNSNTVHEEDNYNLIENIYKFTYTHFKTEMNFAKTYLLNYNSLINDHMKITYTDNVNIKKNEDNNEYLKNNINSLLKKEEEDYYQERKQLFEELETIPKNTLLQNISNIKQIIDSKYFITNNTFNYLQTEISKYLSQFQSQILSYITQLDNLNINILYRLKKVINNQGIYSINFDGLIKIISIERISIQDPIKNLLQKNYNTFAQILTGFGISGIIGGTASFLTGRAVTTVGANAAAGTFGGPVGIGVGVVLGVGTLFAQARHHFKGNRGTINAIFEEINNNIVQMVNNVEDSIKKEIEKITLSMENDIKEIKNFIDILVDRVTKIIAE